jgi:hypothetical protein
MRVTLGSRVLSTIYIATRDHESKTRYCPIILYKFQNLLGHTSITNIIPAPIYVTGRLL